MRRGRVWFCARDWMQSPTSVKCHPQTLALVRPCPNGQIIERSLAPWLVGTCPDKDNRRVGTFLNQRRAGNEVILKEWRQYSLRIPRPIVRIQTSRRMGRSRCATSGIWLPCDLHHGRSEALVQAFESFAAEIDFGQTSGAYGLHQTPSLWLMSRAFCSNQTQELSTKICP